MMSDKSLDVTEDSGFASSSQTFESTPQCLEGSQQMKTTLSDLQLKITPITSSQEIFSSTLNSPSMHITKSFQGCNITATTPDKDSAGSEFFKRHSQSILKTPPKLSSPSKLGSSERNEILYGDLKSNTKLYSPRFRTSRRSPAKKRLFGAAIIRRISMVKLDPVKYFIHDRNIGFIVKRIFSYLSDNDLFHVRNVSKRWRMAVEDDDKLHLRVKRYMTGRINDKENKQSLTIYEVKDESEEEKLFKTMKEMLTHNQYLAKCPSCFKPAIVENNICQCQFCYYIYCKQCNSFSVTGPKDFNDSCKSSMLDLSTSKENELPSFLSDGSSSKELSSFGISPIENTQRQGSAQQRPVFGVSNRRSYELQRPRGVDQRRLSYVPVIPLAHRKCEAVAEPSSPPKVTPVRIGSKASKKNLRRLLL